MVKFLVECERDRVRFCKIKSKAWQMVTIRGRLYRCDDKIACKDRGSDKALIIYDHDQTQPRTCRSTWIDPDFTRALIMQGQIAHTTREIWSKIGGLSIEKILTVMVVGGGVLYWILMQLGL